MKLLIYTLLLLFGTISLIVFANKDPGYVLIARGTKTIEMSLVFFIPATLIGFIVLYILIRLINRTWDIPNVVLHWRQQRNKNKARKSFNRGLVSLAEGDWVNAESNMLAHLRYSDTPLLNYLAAAYAAQGRNDIEKRDEYLAQAYDSADEENITVNMVQAYLQHLAKQPERALATLAELKRQEPKNCTILKLYMLQTLALRDWTSLAQLLPELRRNKVLDEAEQNTIELETYRHLLQLSLPEGSGAMLEKTWESVSQEAKSNPEMVILYSRQLITHDEMQTAEVIIREILDKTWDEKLAELYGLTIIDNPALQLEHAERWLQTHKTSVALLLTLGRLAMRNKLWGKTRTYIDQCIALEQHPDAYLIMGQLLEQEGNQKEALQSYRDGLNLASENQLSTP